MSENGSPDGMPARFKQALQQTEQTRDPQHVAKLFASGAALTNLGGDHGHDAHAFWQTYLEQFEEIRSDFTNEIAGDSGVALEWTSRGMTAEAKPIEYRGISVLEHDGERVTSFRTYYDSAAFVGAEASTR